MKRGHLVVIRMIRILLVLSTPLTVYPQEVDSELIEAAKKGQTAKVRALLTAHGDAKTKQGASALIWAAAEGHTDTVQALLDEGTDVNQNDDSGWTALLVASVRGHSQVVRTLLQAGADVNVIEKKGGTALMFATINDHQEIIRILLQAGAVEHDDENLCLDFSDEDKWCLLQAGSEDTQNQARLVRSHETVQNWTELITFSSSKNRARDLDLVLNTTQELLRSRCRDGFRFAVRSREPVGGFPARIFSAHCRVLSPSSHSSDASETQVQLIIGGHDKLHNVERKRRTSDLDKKTLDQWINFFKTARICGTPSSTPLCD